MNVVADGVTGLVFIGVIATLVAHKETRNDISAIFKGWSEAESSAEKG